MSRSTCFTRWPSVATMLLVLLAGCQRQMSGIQKADARRVAEIRSGLGGGSGDETMEDSPGSGAQPSGWATLKGVFRLEGTPPTPAALAITKDTEVCAPRGRAVYHQAFEVGPDHGIKNVVVYLTSPLKEGEPWTHPSAAPGTSGEVPFDQKECLFLTHVLAIQTSQTLKILNSDPVGHNTKLQPKSGASFDQTIPAGGFTTYRPTAEENAPFPVACAIHPWMSAWILVRDNGYFAVTADDGSFTIPNLPAGVELEFRVWQEQLKFVQDVVVNGQATKWNKGRFTVTLDPSDESKNELLVTIDSGAL